MIKNIKNKKVIHNYIKLSTYIGSLRIKYYKKLMPSSWVMGPTFEFCYGTGSCVGSRTSKLNPDSVHTILDLDQT